ncbi:MAG: acyl carrier protein [Lentisphaerae bacterium GWF2_45_14]|nr:MAG: acyl carrier protein [Lentisphaerae bacterium GWF2_45_14]
MDRIKQELKESLLEVLALDDLSVNDIEDDEPLFGGKLALDSLDAVEIVVVLQRKFGVNTKGLEGRKEIFTSINTLAQYIIESGNK